MTKIERVLKEIQEMREFYEKTHNIHKQLKQKKVC
jgi:hypothetical protein